MRLEMAPRHIDSRTPTFCEACECDACSQDDYYLYTCWCCGGMMPKDPRVCIGMSVFAAGSEACEWHGPHYRMFMNDYGHELESIKRRVRELRGPSPNDAYYWHYNRTTGVATKTRKPESVLARIFKRD